MFLIRAFTRTNNTSSSHFNDRRVKHKPPPISVPVFNQDECFSDGELALRRGNTLQTNTGHKKFTRRRNKSFTASAPSPSPATHGKSASRPKSISSQVLHKIAKNFSRRGDPENAKVLHVFDDKDGNTQAVASPPYTGQVESMPIIDTESNEPLVHRMRANSIGNSTAYQEYQRTQSMELLSMKKQPADVNGKDTQSLDDLLQESPSPSPTPTTKHPSKGWGSKRKKSASLDTDVFVDATSRASSKRSLNDTQEALFRAVVANNRTQVEQLLSSGQNNLAWHNADDLTVLDVAVMLNHTHIAHLLMAYGARESPKFTRNPELRYNHLLHLVVAAEEQINKCRTSLSQSSVNASSQALEEMTKTKEHWSTKKTMLQHMISVYNDAKPPDPPTNVQLDIISSHSLTVHFSEPKKDNGSPVTRYKVEWSKRFDFSVIEGSFVLSDLTYKLDPHSHTIEYTIPDLETGEKYFVRVLASNIKRFGSASYSVPPGAVPCSWHDVKGTEPRYAGSTGAIQTIAMQLKQITNAPSANKDGPGNTNTAGKSKMKRGLSKIFGGALKFHKNLKGGLYFALLMYSDDEKVLVTVDDYLPIVEVVESFNSQTIKQDFLWLSKLACTWENVKNMCDSSESYTVSSTIQFRNRLLHTIIDLQAAIGIHDLGLIHPLPYQNSDSLVIVLVKNMKDPREVQNSSLRWIPQGKLWKKHSSNASVDTLSIPDQLITEAQSIMDHNTASIKPVARGLYLGYLKTRSSLAGVKVVVSKQFPNLLPHTKIRDNPHVSKDEWLWLTYLHQPKDEAPPYVAMETCCELQKLLTMKVVELLTSRGITKKEEIELHRLYINEVVELNENVTFLLLLPPPDQVCTSLGETDRFEHVSYMGMPFTSFEIAQLYTYQKVFITLYTQVSSTLDMELLIAQHRLREAFSKEEISQGKELQEKLERFLQETERVWKNMHWLDSAVQIGRKTDTIHGIPLKTLRRNPMTTQSQSPPPIISSDSSSDQGQQQEDHTANQSKPQHATARFKNRYSSSMEELKVTPLYDTGLAKGSTVKLHVLQMTQVKEVIQLAVKALKDARSKKQPEKASVALSNPSDFYLLCTLDDGYNERILDDEFPILELHRESSNFKLFLKRKADLDSSDCYTTSV